MAEIEPDPKVYFNEAYIQKMGGKRLTVKLEVRPDGGLRVHSDELPGLILSGRDPLKVLADVMPAWTVLATWPTPLPQEIDHGSE